MSEHTTLTKSEKPFHESGGSVKSVSVISTGTGEAQREHIYGTRKPVIYTPRPPPHLSTLTSAPDLKPADAPEFIRGWQCAS